jgi:hypothetical protein
MRLAWIPIATAACANVSEPEFPEPLITVEGGTVTGPDFQMTFARAPDLQLPESFLVRGKSVLGTDDNCNFESNIGFAIFPAGYLGAGAEGFDSLFSDVLVQAGPFIAKLQTSFSADYTCAGATRTATGSSVFTFFPSGRIVREDLDVLPTQDTFGESAGACGCSPNANGYVFTSYWAFDPQSSELQDANNVPITGVMGDSQQCTVYPDDGLALGVAWSGARTRLSPGDASSHVFDFDPGSPDLQNNVASVTSGFFFADTCAEAIAGLADPSLIIDDIRFPTSDVDGIYRDFNLHDSEFDIRPENAVIPAGWAVSIDLDGHAVITRNPPLGGPAAFVQREQGTRSLIYFPDALAPGESITIRPE